MPSLGADMESGTLLEWRVKPGDPVSRGDILAVVDTSKAEIEIEVFEDGVIDELLVPEGTKVPVGAVLATLRSAGTAAAIPPPSAPAPPPPTALPEGRRPAVRPRAPSVSAPRMAPPAHRPRVSPLARRVAQELGVQLDGLTGSGEEGAITRADVERAAAGGSEHAAPPAEAPAPAPAPVPADATARRAAMREAIGVLMARSKREIPHYYLQSQIDMAAALAWLQEQNLTRPVSERLLPSVLLLAAVARAAARTPAMNGFWVDGAFQHAEGVHLGVAISLRGGGLIAPALLDADRRSLDELMSGLRELVGRAREGRLRSSEMSDPTLTVTNLGERGVDVVHGVIYPPQVALVGFGGIRERPWVQEGMIGVRSTVHVTLAADHRASDGHVGSRFLELIDRLLQRPEEL